MKLMMFQKGKGAALGLVEGKAVIDLGVADPSLPKDLQGLIAAGPKALAAAKAAAAKAPASARLVLDAVKPALPIDPSGEVHLRRPQLCAARQGGRARHPDLPVLLPARADLAGGGRRTGDPAEGIGPARLRVRAHHRHRQRRSPHPRGQGARPRVRLHALQRRLRARLPAQDLAVDAGQELRRHRPAGPLDRHRRRAAAGRIGLEDHDPRQRRDHAGFQHLRHDLLHRADDRAPLRVHDARARRSHRHRHAVGRGARAQAASLDEGRRQGRGRSRDVSASWPIRSSTKRKGFPRLVELPPAVTGCHPGPRARD